MNEFCMLINVKDKDECYGNQVKCLNYIMVFKSLDNCELTENAMPINFHSAFIDCELFYNPNTQVHLDKNHGKFDTTTLRN